MDVGDQSLSRIQLQISTSLEGEERRENRIFKGFLLLMEYCRRFMSKRTLFYCLSIFFFSACALHNTFNGKTPCLDIKCLFAGNKAGFHLQEVGKTLEKMNGEEAKKGVTLSTGRTRKFLSGLGSFPPRCTSKCGRCTPCKPVHVPVPPGTPVTAEYYPEAWRCKCGNKLYMP